MKEESKKPNKKPEIDAQRIVSPHNTEKLYGKKLEEEEPIAGQSEEINTSLPEDIDDVDENMFPSAP